MAGLVEKRRSIHNDLSVLRAKSDSLASQLAQLQALANIGTISSMIAHEMNNILTPLANYAQLALNNPNDSALCKKALEKTVSNSARASKILASMLSMANGEKQQKLQCRVRMMIEDVISCIARDFAKDRIRLELDIPEDLSFAVVPIQVQQVFMNLILNAREAMLPGGGNLKINACAQGESVVTSFSDTGTGIEPHVIEKIFDPFFTTKTEPSQRIGAGLGLAFCKQILDAHNGEIIVESKPGSGTIFKVILPAS